MLTGICGLIIGGVSAWAYRLELMALPLMLINLVILFIIHYRIRIIHGRLLLWTSYGLGFYLVSLGWISEHLVTEYGDAIWIQQGLWPFLLLLLTTGFSLVPLLSVGSERASGLFLLPVLLSGLDLLREHVPVSFPWLHPGYLLIDTPFAGLLSLAGALGGSFLIYFFAVLLAYVLTRYPGGSLGNLVYPVFFLLAVYLLQVANVKWNNAASDTSETLNVRLIHGHFSDTEKLSRNHAIERVGKFAALSAMPPEPSLVVWPESSIPMPYTEIRPFIEDYIKPLAGHGVVALFGAQTRHGQYMHNAVFSSKDQAPVSYKQKMVPFGEERPQWFVSFFEEVPLSRGQDLKPLINHNPVFEFKKVKAVIAQCYEAMFSDVYRVRMRENETNLAILMSDIEWTETEWVRRFLLKISRVRAAEVGRPLLYSTNMGFTSHIDSQGNVLSQTSALRTDVLNTIVTLKSDNTFYTQWGNTWLIVLGSFLILFVWGTTLFNRLTRARPLRRRAI